MELIINSRESLHEALGVLRQEWEQHKYVKLKLIPGSHRSVDYNALSHVWYNEIAKQTGQAPDEVKRECKLINGVPILRAEDDEFRALYDLAIKGNLTYEQKLSAMRYLPVTSLMTTPQFDRYMHDVRKRYEDNNVFVEWPDE